MQRATQRITVAAHGVEAVQGGEYATIQHFRTCLQHLNHTACTGFLFSQHAAVGLAGAEAAFGQPHEACPIFRNRLRQDGVFSKDNTAACGVKMREEMGVLAAALAERQREAPALDRGRIHLEQRVAGIAGDDLAIDPHRNCRMEIAAFHPARRIVPVNRRHGAEDGFRTGLVGFFQKGGQPMRRGGLVIIDKGQIIRAAFRQAGIAGNRNIRFRAMNIGDLEGCGFTQAIDACLGARLFIIIRHNQANFHAFRHVQLEE
ncbi:hypothetical protein D3C86_1209820 [compost metagenome]